MKEERKAIESKLRNILELHIYGNHTIPRNYVSAIRTRDGKNAMIILNLADEQQAVYYRMIRSYLEGKNE